MDNEPEKVETMPTEGYFFCDKPSGKGTFTLTPAMIARRNGIARGLGYVLRPCSLGASTRTGETRLCWESEPLTHEWRGRMTAAYHSIPWTRDFNRRGTELIWPDEVCKAAWAIDKGKPLPGDEPKPKPEAGTETPLLRNHEREA